MTRWMRRYRRPATTTHCLAQIKLSHSANFVLNVSSDKGYFPTRVILLAAQETAGSVLRSDRSDEDGPLCIGGKGWVPPEAQDLKLKLLTIEHEKKAGNRGGRKTAAALHEEFSWNDITTDAKDVLANCLLCLLSRSASKVPRPLSTTLYASKPNGVLH